MIDNEHTLVELLLMCSSQDEVKEKESGEGDDISVYGYTSFTAVRLE